MPPTRSSPRWRATRESTRLPDSRRDACVTTRIRWLTFYGELVRARTSTLVAAAEEDAPGEPLDSWELLRELLPLMHSVCRWVQPDEACAWLEEQTDVRVSAANLRMALKNPSDAWALLWRDLREAVWLLSRVHRVSATDLLWEEHLFAQLRSREPHLNLGNLAQTRAALNNLAQARTTLEQRWFILEPRTRDCARQYIGLVTAQAEDAF